MREVYCSNCGLKLKVTRRAIRKFGTIIETVPQHTCLSTPANLNDLSSADIPAFVPKERGKFDQNLDELNPPPGLGMVGTDELRDRRKLDESVAPTALLEHLKQMKKE